MKKVLVSLLSIALIGCSQPILNNTSQYSDLDQEYSQFKTEALTQSYLKKKMDKWLSDSKYSKNLVREIEYAKFKHKDLLKDIVALQPTIFDNITSNTAVTTKRVESSFENYIEYIDPYPSAVTATSATNITTSSFTASWTSNIKASSYKLFVNGSEVYSGSNTNFDVTNLSFGSTPTYYVKAVNSAGTSPNSNTISVTLNPDTVTALDASDITQTSFTANWSSLTGATSYKLKIDNGAFTDVGAVTSKSITALTIGSSHTYSVQAVNAGGTGSSSNIITVNLNPAVPAIPTTLAATNIGQTSFTANWNPVTNASSYKLKIDNGAFTDVGNVTTYDISSLTAGTTHNYYVEASNISGTSTSSTAQAVTLLPASPLATNATNITSTSFTANWNTVSGATSYKLYLNGVETVLGNVNTYNVTGLSPTSSYSYYIKAVNASGDSSNSNTINLSTIEIQLTEVQSIGTLGAFDTEGFTIGTDSYLAVANQWAGFYNTDSKIYKWNGTQFTEIQSIATNSAMNWTYFTIGTDHYLALANYCNGATYNMNETIYKWNGSQFVALQSLPTNGVRNADFFTIGTNSYLVVANFYNDSSYTNQSNIYKWNSTTGKFDATPIQSINTTGAINWTPFTIGTDHYLALADNYSGSSYNNTSKIYKWNGTQFTEIQSFATNGAYDWEFFTIGSDNYIMIANYSDSSSYNIDSKIYKWNSTTGLFNTTPVQNIPTIGVNDLEYFTIGTEHYLAVANSYTGSSYNTISKIYKWNTSTSQFNTTPIHSINTNGAIDWEYFIIGTKHYLTISNHYNDSTYDLTSKIYRLD